MKNGVAVLMVVAVGAAFAGMMRIKTDVQQMARERQRLAVEKLALREQKRVLEAEYALLANPLRLDELAKERGFVELGILQMVGLMPDASVTEAAILRVRDPAPAELATRVEDVPVRISVTMAGNHTGTTGVSGTGELIFRRRR